MSAVLWPATGLSPLASMSACPNDPASAMVPSVPIPTDAEDWALDWPTACPLELNRECRKRHSQEGRAYEPCESGLGMAQDNS